MTDNLNIRFVEETDFPDIFPLLEQLWPNKKLDFNKMQAVFNRNLAADYKRLLCAEYDSKIIGFCSLTLKDNLWQQDLLGYIDELVIEQQFRGKGVGKKLIDSIITIAKESGCVHIQLDSALHRIEAHKFYQNIGFERVAYLFSKAI